MRAGVLVCLLPALAVPGLPVRLSALPAQYEPVLACSKSKTCLEPCYPAFDPLPPSSPRQAAHAATVHAACVCTAPKYPAVKGTCSHGTARCLENANRRDRIRTRDGNCGGWGVGDGASGVQCGDRREPLLRPFSPGGFSNASTAPKPPPAFTSLCACVARCSVTDEAVAVRLVIEKGSVRTFAIFCRVCGHHATPSPNYEPNGG